VVTETTIKLLFIRKLLVVPLLLLIQMSSSSAPPGENFMDRVSVSSAEIRHHSSSVGRNVLHLSFKTKYCHNIFNFPEVQQRCEEIFREVSEKHRWDLRQFNALRLRECLHDRKGGILSLDDTLIEKTGKTMGGVGFLYDSSQKKNVLCHDIVSTFYRTSAEQLSLYFEPYVKKEVADVTGTWFRTKIQIAMDLLRQSLAQVQPAAIVFDEWYMCHELTEFINNHGLTWVSQAKTNRCIQVGEEWIGLARYAQLLPFNAFTRVNATVEEKRFKWFFETTVVMKNVGVVKLVVLKQRKNSRKHTFLVSNTTSLNGMQVLEYYKKTLEH
jgi:hypothetical protein